MAAIGRMNVEHLLVMCESPTIHFYGQAPALHPLAAVGLEQTPKNYLIDCTPLIALQQTWVCPGQSRLVSPAEGRLPKRLISALSVDPCWWKTTRVKAYPGKMLERFTGSPSSPNLGAASQDSAKTCVTCVAAAVLQLPSCEEKNYCVCMCGPVDRFSEVSTCCSLSMTAKDSPGFTTQQGR